LFEKEDIMFDILFIALIYQLLKKWLKIK